MHQGTFAEVTGAGASDRRMKGGKEMVVVVSNAWFVLNACFVIPISMISMPILIMLTLLVARVSFLGGKLNNSSMEFPSLPLPPSKRLRGGGDGYVEAKPEVRHEKFLILPKLS